MAFALLVPALCGAGIARAQAPAAGAKPPDQILLKDYKPVSLHKVPVTTVTKARHPAIDMHSHPSAKTPEDVDRWVGVMDAVGVLKTVLLTGAHGSEFDRLVELYSRHPTRFELWCGFDYTGYDQPGYGPAAVAELERCVRKGAKGVGEEGDKGKGMGFGKAAGLHFDDPRLAPLLDDSMEEIVAWLRRTGRMIWKTHDQMRDDFYKTIPGLARDGRFWALFVNQAGRPHPCLDFVGPSFVVDPSGRVVAETRDGTEQLVFAEGGTGSGGA